MTFSLIIPAVNGVIGVGIAAGADSALDGDKKLKVNVASQTAAIDSAVVSSLEIANTVVGTNIDLKRLMVAAGIMVVKAGLLSLNGEQPTSDWSVSDIVLTEAAAAWASDNISAADMARATLVIFGTKVSYWLTNHHTGGSRLAGYIRKIRDAVVPNGNDELTTRVFHIIGHWADTIVCLSMLSISGLVARTRLFADSAMQISFGDDIALRVEAMPAGAHRLAVAYEVIKRLIKHPLARVFPNLGSLRDVCETAITVLNNPARYHIGATYLTGSPRIDAGLDTIPIGTLGTFIKIVFPRSTVNRSPCITRGNEDVYKEHESYDPGFESVCRAYVQNTARLVNTELVSRLINAASEENTDDAINRVRDVMRGGE